MYIAEYKGGESRMNKGELIDNIANDTNLKKTDISKVIDSMVANIQNTLKDNSEDKASVALVGFGTWKKKYRAARTGRNPQTGKTIEIPGKNTVTFTVGKNFKDAVN